MSISYTEFQALVGAENATLTDWAEYNWIGYAKMKNGVFVENQPNANQLVSRGIYRGYDVNGVSFLFENGIVSAKGTATNSGGRTSFSDMLGFVSLVKDHTYFAIGVGIGDSLVLYINAPSVMRVREKFISNITGSYSFGYNVLQGVTYDYKSPLMIFDATAMYGAGNEPSTLEQFLSENPWARGPVPFTPIRWNSALRLSAITRWTASQTGAWTSDLPILGAVPIQTGAVADCFMEGYKKDSSINIFNGTTDKTIGLSPNGNNIWLYDKEYVNLTKEDFADRVKDLLFFFNKQL